MKGEKNKGDVKKKRRKVLKRIAYGVLALAGLTLLFGYIYYDDAKEYMMSEVVAYVNETRQGHLEVGEMELAVFHQFPSISVKLKEVRFFEHKDSLRTEGHKPVLQTENAYVAFEAWELIRHKNLIISALSLEGVTLDLITYEDNQMNLEKALSAPTSSGKEEPPGNLKVEELEKADSLKAQVSENSDTSNITEGLRTPPDKPASTNPKVLSSNPVKTESVSRNVALSIRNLHLKDVNIQYSNPSEAYASEINVASLDGFLQLEDGGLTADLGTAFEITRSNQFPNIADLGPADLLLDVKYEESTGNLKIRQGELSFNDVKVIVGGEYNHVKGKYIDMDFDASSNNVALLSKIIQQEVLQENMASLKQASLLLKGRLQGQMEDEVPNIEVSFGVAQLNFTDLSGQRKFRDMGFEGSFHSGVPDDFSEASLEIRNLSGQVPGGSVKGNFKLHNFQRPTVRSNVNARLDLKSYDDIFNLDGIDSLKGRVRLNANFDGTLNFEQEHEMDDLGDWSLVLDDVSFYLIPTQTEIRQLFGSVGESKNEVVVDSLSLQYGQSNLGFQGRLKNLYHFIFNQEQALEAEIEISSSELYTSQFLIKSELTPRIDDRITDLKIMGNIRSTENELYPSFFPDFSMDLSRLSFDLDSLPGISNIQGNIDFHESEQGYQFQLTGLQADLPAGKVDIDGKVLLPRDFQTLKADAKINLTEYPLEYAIDLVNDLRLQPLMGAMQLKKSQMNLISGDIWASTTMELIPFAVQEGALQSNELVIQTPDSTRYDIENLELSIDSLYFIHKENSHEIKGIKTGMGELHLDALNGSVFSNIPLDFRYAVTNDDLEVEFSTLRDSVMMDVGQLSVHLGDPPFNLKATYSLENIELEDFIHDYTSEKLIDGKVDANLKLTGTGADLEELLSSLYGDVVLRGDSLNLYGIDLDDILRKYKRSQTFNLADVSAFLLAGPIGTAVTKGADFTSLISTELKPDQRTHIAQAIVDWHYEQGVLQAKDVAFSTLANRVSFDGELDFGKDTIPGFTVHVLDKKGCSLMEQELYGKFGEVQMGKLKIAETLLGSVINLVESLVGKECKVVYSGQVKHPEGK